MRFRSWLCLVWLAALTHGFAAELVFDFGAAKPGTLPAGWKSTVVGDGPAADWKTVLTEAPATLAPIAPQASKTSQLAAVAQLSRDPSDERFPLLYYSADKYGDFKFKARIRLVDGKVEQIAGIAFRIQDERNFYVIRLSRLGDNVRFYKFVNGTRSPPVGPTFRLELNRWYELAVEAEANRLRFLVDGKEVMPPLNDSSFTIGHVGFITKSDTIAHFADARIDYHPREAVADALVREALERYPRLKGVRIFARKPPEDELRIIASSAPGELGQAATLVEREAMKSNQAFFGRKDGVGLVTFPLHDRNGDPIGVVKFTIESFKGQTEANALARVKPIVDRMESRIGASTSLAD